MSLFLDTICGGQKVLVAHQARHAVTAIRGYIQRLATASHEANSTRAIIGPQSQVGYLLGPSSSLMYARKRVGRQLLTDRLSRLQMAAAACRYVASLDALDRRSPALLQH